jgi:hypothetical protein
MTSVSSPYATRRPGNGERHDLSPDINASMSRVISPGGNFAPRPGSRSIRPTRGPIRTTTTLSTSVRSLNRFIHAAVELAGNVRFPWINPHNCGTLRHSMDSRSTSVFDAHLLAEWLPVGSTGKRPRQSAPQVVAPAWYPETIIIHWPRRWKNLEFIGLTIRNRSRQSQRLSFVGRSRFVFPTNTVLPDLALSSCGHSRGCSGHHGLVNARPLETARTVCRMAPANPSPQQIRRGPAGGDHTDGSPWPVAADGAGLHRPRRPSLGEGDPPRAPSVSRAARPARRNRG